MTHIEELAEAMALQCQAVVDGKTPAGLTAAAIRIRENADTLLAWAKEHDETADEVAR